MQRILLLQHFLEILAVFIDDTNIISFLEILSKFSKNGDVFVDRDIRKILQIISKRFNGSIANTCQNIIFLEFNAQYHLASYFDGMAARLGSLETPDALSAFAAASWRIISRSCPARYRSLLFALRYAS